MSHKSAVEYPPSTGREFLAFLDQRAGRAYLIKKFKVENGTIIKWIADPQYTGEDSVRQNPIEKFEDSLTWCVEHGHIHEARSIVSRLARIAGCSLTALEPDQADRDADLRDLMLDDDQSLSAFHAALRALRTPEYVRFLGESAVMQIQRAILRFEAERWEQWRTDRDDTYPNGTRPLI